MLTSRMLPEEMLTSRLLFQRYLDFKHFDIDMLLKVAYIFGMTPMTGITTINNLAWKIVWREIPIHHWTVSWFCKMMLLRQIHVHFWRIRREDEIIVHDKIFSTYSEEEINSMSLSWAIELEKTFHQKCKDLKMWNALSNQWKVSNQLLLYSRIISF